MISKLKDLLNRIQIDLINSQKKIILYDRAMNKIEEYYNASSVDPEFKDFHAIIIDELTVEDTIEIRLVDFTMAKY